jgi:nuclear transport factor 2 (NTF2) superfamily protein
VEFWYEYSEKEDVNSQWFRTYGIEHWVFEVDGRMKSRQVGRYRNTLTVDEWEYGTDHG